MVVRTPTATPPPEPWIHNYLRVRVDSPEDVRRLRAIGEVDGLRIVPSLDSRGRLRPFSWRWPFRVGVVAGPVTEEWLNTVKLTQYYPPLFDAEVFDAARSYDIGILSATELSSLPDDVAQRLGESACVIVVGDGPVEQHLTELDRRIEPAIAIAVDGRPSQWWIAFFEEMAHNVPVDAAVESIIDRGVDALIAGPRFGMDITAAARWFAAVGPDFPQLSPLVDELTDWDWGHESGGAMEVAVEARSVRTQGGDPVAFVPALPMAPPLDEEAEEVPKVEKPPEPRRLVARVYDGDTVVESILPPKRALKFGVRVAIPERGDVGADKPAPSLPGTGPTVKLKVVVRSDVWEQQPPPKTISISRQNLSKPSTWVVFPFTTPDEDDVVSIEIRLSYKGKRLQQATYESAVRAEPFPGERPTLDDVRVVRSRRAHRRTATGRRHS